MNHYHLAKIKATRALTDCPVKLGFKGGVNRLNVLCQNAGFVGRGNIDNKRAITLVTHDFLNYNKLAT